MRTIRTRTVASAVAMAAGLSLAPMGAQTTQAALSKEAGTLSDKFAGLARVMEDASKLPKITDALLKKGYSEADVGKILGGNILRVMEAVERLKGE